MSKAFAALAALLVVASSAWSQITGPAEASFKLNEPNAAVLVKATADITDAQYEILSDTLDVQREFEGVEASKTRLKIRVRTDRTGTGWIVVAGTQGGKLAGFYKCRVVVGSVPVPPGPSPVPPAPVPVPPDPTPVPDALTKALTVAAAKDGLPKARLQDLADGLRSVAVRSVRSATRGDLETLLITELAAKIKLKDVAPSVRLVVQTEVKVLDAIMPPDKLDEPLTDAQRQRAKDVFTAIADAAERASK